MYSGTREALQVNVTAVVVVTNRRKRMDEKRVKIGGDYRVTVKAVGDEFEIIKANPRVGQSLRLTREEAQGLLWDLGGLLVKP